MSKYNIKPKKARKPRGVKKAYRRRSEDLCSCGTYNCDPIWHMGKNIGVGMRKIKSRLDKKLCMGCGKPKEECICKSSL